MVAFVTGSSLGLGSSSLALIGSNGVVGNAQTGRADEQVYLNMATGNLVVQRQDEWVDSMEYGPGTSVVRTYNSQGLFSNSFKDNWMMSVVKTLGAYTANSSITRTDGDGTALVYTFDSASGSYINKTGAGAFDTLTLSGSTWTWKDGATGNTETYDTASLKIQTASDREGNTTHYNYTSGQLTSITDAAGETTAFGYTGNLITSISTTAADGSKSTRVYYTYDTSNSNAVKLTSVKVDLSPNDNSTTDTNVYTSTYTYNSNNLLASITQSDGTSLSFTYQSSGGLQKVTQITQTLAGGATRITKFSYLASSTTVTDPLSNVTTFTYDSSKRLTKIQYPSTATGQPSVNFTYGTNNQLATQTDARGNVIEYFYDSMGRQTEQRSGTNAIGQSTSNGTGDVIDRTYSATTGVLLSETVYQTPDPDGNAVGSASASNPLTTTYVYNSSQTHVHFMVSPQGRVTEYRYDSYGRRTSQITYGDQFYSGALNEAALNTWVAAADKTQGTLTQTAYTVWNADLIKDVTTYATVDSTGAGVADGTQSVTRYIYDPAGELLYTIGPDRVGTSVDGVSNKQGTTHYTYDGLGRVLTQCDAAGNLTTYSYDDAHNTTTIAYANGLTTTRVYDAAGELLTSTDSGAALGTTQYWYDADGNLRMAQDPTGVKSYSLFDQAGRRVASIDRDGSLTEYTYNLNGQVAETINYATLLTSATLASLVDASGNPSTTVTLAGIRPAATSNDRKSWNLYEQDGRLLKSVDELGYVTQNYYDGASRLTKTVRWANPVVVANITTSTLATDAAVTPAANATLDQTTQSFYDSDGKLAASVAPDGSVTQNVYDAAGRLRHTVTYANAGSVSTNSTTGLPVLTLPTADNTRDAHTWYFYDDQNRLTGQVDPDGNFTEYTYDASGNKTSRDLYASSGIVSSALTLATTQAMLDAQVSGSQTTYYSYTDLNQLATRTDPDGTVTQFTYDAAGNLLRTDRAVGTADLRTSQVKVDGYGRVINELTPQGSAALAALGSGATAAQIQAVWNQYQVTYTYDNAGRKATMVDQNGLKTIYYYDNAGNLAYTINAAGEVAQNVYSGANAGLEQIQQVVRYGTRLSASALSTLTGGLLTSAATTTLSIGNAAVDSTVTNTYANDNLIVVKDGSGNYTRYLYGAMNRLQYELDSTNGLTAFSYDMDGRVVSTTTYAQAVPAASIAVNTSTPLTAAMFTSTLLSSITNSSRDNTSTSVYDSLGRVAYVVSGNGAVESRTYDFNGNVLTDTKYAKTITLPSALTLASVQQAVAVVANPALDQVNYFTYDSAGRVTYQADAMGDVTTFQYDALGNLVDRHSYATPTATPAAHTIPPEDQVHDAHERWIYDSAGHVLGAAVSQGVVNGNQMWAITLKSYDRNGNVLSSTQYASLLSGGALAASPSQAQVATWMNSVGANGAQDRTTSMTYDNAGRLATSTDAAGTVTSYYYDSANRVSQSMVQGAGQTLATRTVYDALGRVVYTIDPLGDATLNTYDANGNVIAVRRYANAISAANLATLTPTATAANVAALISPDNTNDRIQRSVYDGQNRLVYSIDGVGDVTMNTYDGTGKVVAVRRYASPINLSSYPASPTVSSVAALITANNTYDRITTNVFDADNRLRFVIDPAGYVTETQYDALGQVLETLLYTTPISTATAATVSAVAAAVSNQMSSAHTVSNAYDAAGHLLSTTDARGNTESYQYDALGNKKAFTNKAGNTWTYSYDAQGRQLSETDPSVTLNTVAIDGVGNVNVATPASVNLATINTYDAFGDLTSRTEGVGSSQQRTTSYAYDRLGRQTGTTFPAVASGTPQAAVTYDSLGNATTSQDVGNKYSFKVYDGNGRVLYDIDAAGYITGYVRNAFGEVTQLTRYGRGMSSLGAGPVSLTQVQSFLATANHDDDRVITTQYDAAGRMVKTIEPQGYAWDPAHNLNPTKSSTFTASKATATTYNAFGEMLKQSVFGQDSSGVVQTVSADTFYSYNARGQQIAQIQIQDRQPGATSASGYLTARSYDAAGNVTDEIQYSVQQNFADSAFSTITGMAYSAPSSDSQKRETAYSYDANNSKLTQTQVGITLSTASDGSETSGNAVTSYAYDAVGNLVSTTDATGTTTYSYRDALGRVTAVATMSQAQKNEQIAQIFLALLGRAPAASDLTYYATWTPADIARGVYNSPEGQNWVNQWQAGGNPSTAFITQLYQNLMGRSPDSGGLSFWLTALSNEIATAGGNVDLGRQKVVLDMMGAVQSAFNQDAAVMNALTSAALSGGSLPAAVAAEQRRVQIAQIYVAILGRAPDPTGLAYYGNGSTSITDIARLIYQSPEAQNLYPSSDTPSDIVSRIYESINGQAPDLDTLNSLLASFPSDLTSSSSQIGSFVVGLIQTLTNGAGSPALNAFVNKAMAGLPEAIDSNATAGTLSTFLLDAYGNTVVRHDWAAGAQYVGGTSVGMPTSSDPDRLTYTQYDLAGRATATVDADGHASYSIYDNFGHDVQDTRTVTLTSGATTYTVSRQFDNLGRLIELDDGDQHHSITYNAFGEVTGRSTNGTSYEYDDYDTAGHLWRTNAGDGVDKVYLYDVLGDQTSKIEDAEVSLKTGGFTTAASVVTAAHLVRTDYTYDLRGNVVTEQDPTQYTSDIGTVSGATVASVSTTTLVPATVSTTVVATMQEVALTTGDAATYQWQGANSVSVQWMSLAGLGGGDVRVVLSVNERTSFPDQDAASGATPTYVSNTITKDFPADQGLNGATLTWAGSGALSSIQEIQVYKKDVSGNWVMLVDRPSSGPYGTLVRVDAPADPNTAVQFLYRPSGTSTWTTVGWQQLAHFGDGYAFVLPSLAEGTYDYQVTNQATGATSPATVDNGTFGLVNTAARQMIAQLYAAILHRAPDVGGFGYYLNQINAGTATLSQVAQEMISSPEANLAGVTAASFVQQLVTNGLGIANYQGSGSELDADATTWQWALGNNQSSWGAYVVGTIIPTLAGYTGSDVQMLAAQANLSNETTAGLDYAIKAGAWWSTYDSNTNSYLLTEEQQVITAITGSGGSLQAAEAIVNQAIARRQLAEAYVVALNRTPDPIGWSYYLPPLQHGSMTIDAVAQLLLSSTEAQNEQLYWSNGAQVSDTQFVRQVFAAAGRTASASDIANWTGVLGGDTSKRGSVMMQIINSIVAYAGTDSSMFSARQLLDNKVAIALTAAQDAGVGTNTANLSVPIGLATQIGQAAEYGLIADATGASTALTSAQAAVAQMQADASAASAAITPTSTASNSTPVETYRRQIAQLYIALLNRSPDASGLASYVNWMIGGEDITTVASNLLTSSEGKSAMGSLTDSQFVTAIYNNAFGVNPTQAQSTQWLGLLSQGQSRASVAEQIVESVVNMNDANSLTSRTLFANKISVSLAFAVQMNGGNNDLASCRAVISGMTYTNTDAGASISTAQSDATTEAWNAAKAVASTISLASQKASADSTLAAAVYTDMVDTATDNQTSTTATAQIFKQLGQLYLGALLRSGSYSELDYWYQQYSSGATMDQIAQGILTSSEGQTHYALSLSNTNFLNTMYQNWLNRPCDASGLQYWTNLLNSGQTRGQVMRAFLSAVLDGQLGAQDVDVGPRSVDQQNLYNELHSDASAAQTAGYAHAGDLTTAASKALADFQVDIDAYYVVQDTTADNNISETTNASQYHQLQQLFLGGLGRAGSLSDENYWYQSMQGGSSIIDVANSFLNSTEGQGIYGGTTNSAFVNQVYVFTFGRSADSSGLNTWTKALTSGQTRGQVMWGIIQSLVNLNSSTDTVDMGNKKTFLGKVSSAMSQVNTAAQSAANSSSVAYTNAVNSATSSAQGVTSSGDASATTLLNASQDAKNRVSIGKLYTLMLGHGPDAATFNSWASQMLAGTATLTQIATAILASAEGQQVYPSTLSNAQFVNTLYLTTFGRAATSAEQTNWSSSWGGSRAQAVVNMFPKILAYSGTDASQIQAQNMLNDKTQVDLYLLTLAAQAVATDKANIAAEASKVLTDHTTPSDIIVNTSTWLASSWAGTRVAGQLPKTIARTYDRWGNLLTQSDPRNNAWVTTYTYNADNEVRSRTDALGNVSHAYYDSLGRQVATKDANGNVSGTVYDVQGNVIKQVHADGGEIQRRYDAFGDVLEERGADGEMTAYTYDSMGRVLTKTDADKTAVGIYSTSSGSGTGQVGAWYPGAATSVGPGQLTQTYAYDELGRRVSATDALGVTTTTSYDLHGNVLASTDGDGHKTTFTYDAFNHKTTQTNADGQVQSWSSDAYGRLLGSIEVSGRGIGYSYNYLGLLKQQQSDTAHGAAQNLIYTYDDSSGQLVAIEDDSKIATAGTKQVTQYAYDLAGNHTREKTSTVRTYDGAETDVAQDNYIDYDALGRESEVRDARYDVLYGYDANGNRIHERTQYVAAGTADAYGVQQGAGSTPTVVDSWSRYDAMNRATIVDGSSSDNGTSITIGSDAKGNPVGEQIAYDSAGNRTFTAQWGTLVNGGKGFVRQGYAYDAAGRLIDTWRQDAAGYNFGTGQYNGGDIDHRDYDGDGRIVQSGQVGLNWGTSQLAAAGIDAQSRLDAYDGAGNLVVQALVNAVDPNDGVKASATLWYNYDQENRVTSFDKSMHDAGYAQRYIYSYTGYGDGSEVQSVTVWSEFDGGALNSIVGQTTSVFDANGYTVQVNGSASNAGDTRALVNDVAGRVLRKTQVDAKDSTTYHVTTSLVANGEEIGSASDALAPSPSTFNQDFSPITDQNIAGGAATYTVQQGQTLQSIAKAVWGNADLWYLIADANGVSTVNAGDIIVIPPKSGAIYNNVNTFAPYNAQQAQGDLTPTVAPPQPSHHHSWFADIAAAVVAMVAVITVQPELLEAAMALGETCTAATIATADVVAAAGAGAVASIAAQSVEIAAGNQHGINWNGVALGALGAGITAGVGEVATGALAGNTTMALAGRAALANALTQGIGVATGLQHGFNWHSVAASAVGVGIGSEVSPAFSDSFGNTPVGQFGARLATRLVAGGAAAIARGGRIAVQQVAVDAFGNAIGSSLADQSSSGSTLTTGDFARTDRAEYALQQFIAQSDGIQSKRFAEMDAYTPASEYDYRNGMDIQSDQAWDQRVTREIQSMKVPDFGADSVAFNQRQAAAAKVAQQAYWDRLQQGAWAGRTGAATVSEWDDDKTPVAGIGRLDPFVAAKTSMQIEKDFQSLLRTQPTTVDGWQQQGAAITELANRYQSTMDAAGRGTDPSLLASMGFRRSIADYQVSGDGSQLAKTSLAYGAILGIENGPAMGESPSVWKAVDPRTRGKLIESQLAATEYKDWFHVGALDNGYFPLVDFQRGQTLVSLKSVNTEGSSWMADMQEHIYYLGRNGAEVNGAPARMVLDLRVQPGGQQAALPLISYGRQNGVTVIVREFH